MDQLSKEILQKIHSYNDKNEEFYFKISFECHYCKARLTNRNLCILTPSDCNYSNTEYFKVRCYKCNNRYFIRNKKDDEMNKIKNKVKIIQKKKLSDEWQTQIFSDDDSSEDEYSNIECEKCKKYLRKGRDKCKIHRDSLSECKDCKETLKKYHVYCGYHN